jgi:hypothetical protein
VYAAKWQGTHNVAILRLREHINQHNQLALPEAQSNHRVRSSPLLDQSDTKAKRKKKRKQNESKTKAKQKENEFQIK